MGNPIIDGIKNAVGALLPVGAGVSVGSAAASATGSKSAVSSAEGDVTGAAKSAANAVGSATGLGSVGTDISDVAGFTSALGNKSLWIRVAKVTVGGSIMLIGIMHLTGADGKIARTAIKYAPLM